MKKFSKIIVLVLSLALAISAFAIASSAKDAPFLVEGLYRENWADAIDNADAETPIELLGDYQVQNGENVEVTTSVTIKLNGYTLIGAEDGGALFNVTEQDAVLKILGPGKISVNGTLAEIDAKGAELVLDGGEKGELEIRSSSNDSVFVVGGTGKASARTLGAVSFVNAAGANLFELRSSSSLLIDNSSVSISSVGATSASGLVLATAGTKVNITNGAEVNNTAGHIVKLADTEEELPVTIRFENSNVGSHGMTYGTLVDFGEEYATFTSKASNITATGYAFVAADTILDYTGSGAEKVYKTPNATVNLLSTTYDVPVASKSDACLFYGNMTGVVIGGYLKIATPTGVACKTRLWDGSTGILIKAGVLFSQLASSELAESSVDEDGTPVYFDPYSGSNMNFSLDKIDGKPAQVVQADIISDEHTIVSQYVVGLPRSYFFYDTKFSTNFEDVNLYSAEFGDSYGERHPAFIDNSFTNNHGSVKVLDNKESGNRYLKLEFDDTKQYNPAGTGTPYFSLLFGHGASSYVSENVAQKNQDFVTVDFDISSDFLSPDGETCLYLSSKWYLMQRIRGAGWAWNPTNMAQISQDGTARLGTWSELDAANTYQLPTTPGMWSHITVVMELITEKTLTGELDRDRYTKESRIHFYVDGQYVGTDYIFKQMDYTDVDVPLLNASEFRFELGNRSTTYANGSGSMNFDNFVMTFYPDGYTGDLNKIKEDKTLNLKDISDAVFKEGYVYPSNIGREDEKIEYAAKVDGILYQDMDEAFAAVVEGSEVELLKDYEGVYNATMAFTVKSNGYKFQADSSTHRISSSKDENDNDVYTIVATNSFVPVYWDINISYETKAPLGVVPVFNGTYQGYQRGNQWIGLVGWSYTEGATEPEELRPISKEDIDRGYVILYPVFDVVRVNIEFRNSAGEPIGDSAWFDVGESISALNTYNNGSVFESLDVHEWYRAAFSSWKINGGDADTVGKDAVYAVPSFDKIEAAGVKLNYTLKNLTHFTPNIYVEAPELYPEIKVLGASTNPALSEDDLNAMREAVLDEVNISGVKHYYFDVGIPALTPDEFVQRSIYLYFEVSGQLYIQEVLCDVNSYLENILLNPEATDAEKTAVMNTMRMISVYLENANAPANEVCERYLANSDYALYLTDYSTLLDAAKNKTYTYTDGEITYGEFYINNTQGDSDAGIDGLFDHMSAVRWNFVTGQLDMYVNRDVHPLITASYSGSNGVFAEVGIQGGSRVKVLSDNLSKGIYSIDLANSVAGWGAIEYGFETPMYILMQGHELPDGTWDRTNVFTSGGLTTWYGIGTNKRTWNMVFHLIYLNELSAEGDTSIAAELELTNAIFAVHHSSREAMEQSGKYTQTPAK